jgi:hypothetical protein
MPVNTSRASQLLRNFDFPRLFIDELGWDRHNAILVVTVLGLPVKLSALAQKRGMVVYHCPALSGQRLPEYAQRRKIEHQVFKTTHEHLIIYTDPTNTTQVWQWVRREPGRPAACREHTYHSSQPGDALLQKLQPIFFSLEEEERLSLSDVTAAARAGFDVERVTKRFYDRFQNEHAAFLKFITGITETTDREWYASVMLNRLMFLYFMQRKGFLDSDRNYLRNRLIRCRKEKGQNKFYSFYRYFLLRLFHEGLGGRKRSAELDRLVGQIPYLNGGIFGVHELERPEHYGDSIEIPDEAFEHIFEYFDQYHWHLDERPLRADNEINPDVLGYIFEKYINQKQMGAYYTKEDITEYICKNTLLPFLFDATRSKCRIAFENPNGPTIWNLLRDDPDRYIYGAVRHGISWDIYGNDGKGAPLDTPRFLPREIADGVDTATPPSLRAESWNSLASSEYALPNEIWREVVARRKRYEEIRQTLAAGEVREVNDLITLNLDIHQFAQGAIENCEGPELLRAFWQAIQQITILDPTCGSGAFLFAALKILEPLYQACVDRMEVFVADLERSGEKHRPERLSDFRRVLERVDAHPNRRYFILKSIILNNLFGVDIMEEAAELCKLRLFLKLAAQIEPDAASSNFGVEPLPDIDFNIRAGNTLVGYVRYDEVQNPDSGSFDFDSIKQKIAVRAADLQLTFDTFRQRQIEGDGSVPTEHKLEIRRRLKVLEDELDRYLAGQYGVRENDAVRYAEWTKSHQPFHWFAEFHRIMSSGGFDVIVGNPPYRELTTLYEYEIRGFVCEQSGNIYAPMIERSAALGRTDGRQGYIVPVSSVSTDRYATFQRLIARRVDHFSSFDDRPSRLFEGLEHIRLTIHLLGRPTAKPSLFSTRYNKWTGDERPTLFAKLGYVRATPALVDGTYPKLCCELEKSIIQKLACQNSILRSYFGKTGRHKIYYSRKVGYFLQVVDFVPSVLDGTGTLRPPSEFKVLSFESQEHAKLALCCLNSNLFYWFITVFSDCRHVNKREVDAFPIDLNALATSDAKETLICLVEALMSDLKKNSVERTLRFKHDTLTVQCIYPKASKAIIDKVDRALAHHYGFTTEELDFIVNYDIKYRMGRDTGGEDG